MKIFLALISIFFTGILFAQDYNIRGFIYLKSTGEPAPFEKVKLAKESDGSTVTGAITDVNGFFSMPKLNQGTYLLIIENYTFKKIEEKIVVDQAEGILNLKYELAKDESIKEIDEVNVSAESKQKKTEVLISQIKLDKKGLERIPSMGAENDIVGALSVTPGVITTGDQGGQLYVRGGTPIQNKILLDGMTIYSPFHSIGFFSVFETELIKNADVYTGGFDAKFGGRISSVMDITYRDGNRKNFGGKLSVSPFLAKAVLEGPFSKPKDGSPSKASYIFSAKKSLLDYSSKSLYPRVNDGNGLPFNFTDGYGKITINADGGSKFSVFAFHNRDSVYYPGIADIDWRATGGGINFILVPSSSPIFIRGHVNGSNYKTTFNEVGAPQRFSSIGGFDLGFDFTYFMRKESEFNYGINIGGFTTDFQTSNEALQEIRLEGFNTEISAYVSYRLIKNRWVVQPSLRVQAYATLNTISLEPRFGAKYNVNEKFRLKFSGGRYSQNFTSASSDKDVVNLFNGLLSAPSNVQSQFTNQYGKTVDVKNGIQYSWHAIVGTEIDITKKWSANIEGYYKYFPQLSNINVNKQYEDNATNASIPDILKKDFLIESGASYGVDLLLKYSQERLFLWGVYSFGKSLRWDGVKEYFPVFDRRHNINLVGTYIVGKKKELEISIRWNLGSGLPFTPTAAFYQGESFSGGVTTDFLNNNPQTITTKLGELNSERLPTYHRLDITVKKQFNFKNKDVIEIIASVTNVYDRKNIFYVNRVSGETIYQFPVLPSLGISYKF
mgnify:CR=1 FL=1|jgi:hypothetical protein|tara:strand:- start:8687 stop:11029 length:2343 start_codon:yes stop_codon:yes gene_type:complete